MRRRNRPRPDQPLLPLKDTVRPASDLDREVEAWAKETRREPIEGQMELPITEKLRTAMRENMAWTVLDHFVRNLEPFEGQRDFLSSDTKPEGKP